MNETYELQKFNEWLEAGGFDEMKESIYPFTRFMLQLKRIDVDPLDLISDDIIENYIIEHADYFKEELEEAFLNGEL